MSKKNIKRRDFFKIAAVSGASAAIASCTADPVEKVLPYIVPPDDYVTGNPQHFATLCQECPSQCGLVVKTREGRAIKIEGNEFHPMNQGKVCAVGQASLQTLYSQDRITTAVFDKKELKTSEAVKKISEVIKEMVEKGEGSKIAYVSEAGTSTLHSLERNIFKTIGAKEIIFDAHSNNSLALASEKLFLRKELPYYRFEKIKFLLNFGADFLETWKDSIRHTREYTEFHAYKNNKRGLFTHISSHCGITGTNADEWISCPTGSELAITSAFIAEILPTAKIPNFQKIAIKNYIGKISIASVAKKYDISLTQLKTTAKNFIRTKSVAIGGGNVTAGKNQTELQIAIHILNYIAGNIGESVLYGVQHQIETGTHSIQQLLKDIKASKIKLVVVNKVNPVYSLPLSSKIKEIFSSTRVVSLSTEYNETTDLATDIIPLASSFESWGDTHFRKGSYALQQPVMGKIKQFDSIECGDFFLQLARSLQIQDENLAVASFVEYLKLSWMDIQKKVAVSYSFPQFWKKSLQKGGVFKKISPEKVEINIQYLSQNKVSEVAKTAGFSLLAVNSNFHSNRGTTGNKLWLLEIPHPITQAVWDSWVEINPDTAEKMGITHGDEVEVTTQHGSVKLAAYVYQHIHENTLAIPTGLGKSVLFPNYSSRVSFIAPFTRDNRKENIRTKVGINPMEIFSTEFDSFSGDIVYQETDVKVKPTGIKSYLVTLDGQYRGDIEALHTAGKAGYGDRSQKGRGFIKTASLGEANRGKFNDKEHHLRKRKYTTDTENPSSFYKSMERTVKEHPFGIEGRDVPDFHKPYKFEMVIDLDKCTGCSACVVACYAENNIAIVGKERAGLGREMSWLRIERYYEKNKKTGKLDALVTPQMCQQCGNAGCEAVCPVYATYHNPDGLNVQVYNRCVGTRYCANNCIYKQRRFNWRTYEFPFPSNMQLNPDVTVRDKGVMEKCTFCVQRIRDAKSKAKDNNRLIRDGEVKTACQQTCPTSAITFGNATDKNSKVSDLKRDKRAYHQLEDANYLPAITYLRKVQI